MEIEFPLEFIVAGTPVSLQAKRPASRDAWRQLARTASRASLPDFFFASDKRLAVTIYYFPLERMRGDIDNIVKPILDALSHHIYMDDEQIERLVVQKFESGNAFEFARPSTKLAEAIKGPTPVLFVRLSEPPFLE